MKTRSDVGTLKDIYEAERRADRIVREAEAEAKSLLAEAEAAARRGAGRADRRNRQRTSRAFGAGCAPSDSPSRSGSGRTSSG